MNTYTLPQIKNCEKKAWRLGWLNYKARRKMGRKLSPDEMSVYKDCLKIVEAFSYAVNKLTIFHDTSFPSRWCNEDSNLTVDYPYYTAIIDGKEIQFNECDLRFYH